MKMNRKTTTKNSFWSNRSSSNQTSNYWLKDSLFNKEESMFDTGNPVLKIDHYALSKYQTAIGNFVRIMTGRSDISVRYKMSSDANFTDGKVITISPKIKEKEFDYSVGLALHEASHILHTDFNRLESFIHDMLYGNFTRKEMEDRKLLWNLIEDLFIDASTYKISPGYRGYYAALYQKVFGSPKIEKGFYAKEYCEPTIENYFFHLINLRNPNRNLDALPGLREMFDKIDMKNITRLTDTEDRIKLSSEIYDMILKNVEKENENQSGGSGDQSDQKGGGLPDGQSGSAGDNQDDQSNNDGQGDEETEDDNNDDDQSDGDDQEDQQQDQQDLSLRELGSIEKAIQEQRKFLLGNVNKGKLSKKDVNVVNAYSTVDISMKDANLDGTFGKSRIPVKIIRNITKEFSESGAGRVFGIRDYSPSKSYSGTVWSDDSIEKSISLGKSLAKKLQIRNEERLMKSTRLDSGKIDKRLLHEIGMDNYKVFSKINIESYKPSFIHISIDQSQSMDGYRWRNAINFATMMAAASKFISNIHLVITTRSTSTYNVSHGDQAFVMTIFDSKKNSIADIRYLFERVRPVGTTPEGLVFEALMGEIQSMSKNTDAYFINLCDGEPYYSHLVGNDNVEYFGLKAQAHCSQQMRKMEAMGINFTTYFIGDERYTFDKVRVCYGSNAHQIKSPSDIHDVAKKLNKNLLAKK